MSGVRETGTLGSKVTISEHVSTPQESRMPALNHATIDPNCMTLDMLPGSVPDTH